MPTASGLVDVAPELPGAMDFIRNARKICAVSLAHTEAGYETALQALEAGADHITHMYNAIAPLSAQRTRRHWRGSGKSPIL